MTETLVLATVISCSSALLITPIIRALALRWHLVDAPDGFRKLHGRSVPLGGGLSVALAMGMTAALAYGMRAEWAVRLVGDPGVFAGAAAGALLICLVGLIDDRCHLRGRQKLVGQVAAASLVVFGGTTIREISFFGAEIDLGLLAVPFTVLWLLGAVNSLNLIDGIDGLATTVGSILSIAVGLMALLTGHFGEAAVALVLAGALLGFLPYNWPPAKMFLGDAGSMFIGLCLGILAIRSSLKTATTAALVAPMAIWAVPLFDVAMAIVRRKLTGQSIYTTDRGHLHHVLQRHGLGGVATVLVIAGLCLACGLGALASVFWQSELTAAIVCVVVLTVLVATRSFGHSECRLSSIQCHAAREA